MNARPISSYVSGMPDLVATPASPSSFSPVEKDILSIVHARWPTSSLEIAEFLGHTLGSREEKRLFSSRITYHIKKLVRKRHLMSKRFGHSLVVWPYHVETLRVMHEMMRTSGERES